MPAVKITEAKIEKKVVAWCKKHRLYCRKFASPNNRGVPDRLIGRNGKMMFLELKSLGNKPTPLQEREIKEINQYGLHAFWVDNYEDAVKGLSEFFRNEIILDPKPAAAATKKIAGYTPLPPGSDGHDPELESRPAKRTPRSAVKIVEDPRNLI